jgi:CMP-N-acetylneuraminic acid synthetase
MGEDKSTQSYEKKLKVLGFIPARSGSKGIKDKNICRIKSVPLVAYTVFCALDAKGQGFLDEIIVSTDKEEYLEFLQPLSYDTKYRRPPILCKDTSRTIDAIFDALHWYKIQEITFDAVMVLQPTAPFRTPFHIEQAINFLNQNPKASCVTGITQLHDIHPTRIKILENSLWLQDICDHFMENEPSRRQDLLPKTYIRNGSIYLTPSDNLQTTKKIRGSRALGMEMHEAYSVNIDTPIDLLTAKACLEYSAYKEYLDYFDSLIDLYRSYS